MITQPTASLALAYTLRQVAVLLAEHPDLPAPYVTVYNHIPHVAELKWFLHISNRGGPAEQKATAQTIVRTLGGTWDKSFDDTSADFTQRRDGLALRVTVTRDAVCERVVVGTETVTIPAQPATEAQPEQTVEREIVEWRCGSILAEDEAVSA